MNKKITNRKKKLILNVARGLLFAAAIFGITAQSQFPDGGPAWAIVLPSLTVLGLFAVFNTKI